MDSILISRSFCQTIRRSRFLWVSSPTTCFYYYTLSKDHPYWTMGMEELMPPPTQRAQSSVCTCYEASLAVSRMTVGWRTREGASTNATFLPIQAINNGKSKDNISRCCRSPYPHIVVANHRIMMLWIMSSTTATSFQSAPMVQLVRQQTLVSDNIDTVRSNKLQVVPLTLL
jgi:hypothetical protein